MQYRAGTGVHQVFANSASLPDGTTTGFSWIGDGSSDGKSNGSGRIWFIAVGQLPVH